MAHQIRLDLDDESAAQFTERGHAQQEIEREPTELASLLDRIPGAWERIQLGREQANRGETVGLDEL